MPRPKTRPEGARRLGAWLSPAAFDTLDAWQERKGFATRTETMEAIMLAVARKIRELEAPPERRHEPESKPRETLDDYAEEDEEVPEETPGVWEGEDAPPRGHSAWIDLHCTMGECRGRQWTTPSGVTCRRGHGGAPGTLWDAEDEAIWAARDIVDQAETD